MTWPKHWSDEQRQYYLELSELLQARDALIVELLGGIMPDLYELNPYLAEAVGYLLSCHDYARDPAFPDSIRSWLIARWDCTHLMED